MKNYVLIAIAFTVSACSHYSSEKPDSFIFEKGEKLAELKNKTIHEASGLAASRTNPGFLWTLNDSGNRPQVYLIDQKLNIISTISIRGVRNRDWEDLAIGPGPDPMKSYVYVGDIGDNLARHDLKYIYRFEEPVLDSAATNLTISQFDTITFKLPYERQDTETLMVDPLTRDIFIVTKREKSVTVYRVPASQTGDHETVAEIVNTLDISGIVAGAFSRDGSEIILKNIFNVFYWKRDPGMTVKEAFEQQPQILEYKREPQGEAITFAIDGSGYYTLSEVVPGEKSYLWFYRRKSLQVNGGAQVP